MLGSQAGAGGCSAAVRFGSMMTVLACICLAPPSAHAESTLDKIRRTNTMVIAHPQQQFPFAELGPDGKPVGYAIDLCNKIADAVRREIRRPQMQVGYLQVTSAERFPALEDGRADIECGVTTNNAQRRQRFDFTIPHFFTTSRMMVRRDAGIRTWNDLRDKRVVVVRGTSVVPYAKARSEASALGIKWLEVDREAEAVAMVSDGRADAYTDDDVMLKTYRSEMKKPDVVVVLGEALSVDPYAMMMRKDAAFKAVVDREMARLIASREIYAIYDRWFLGAVGPDGARIDMPMNYLLRDSFQFPSDKVAE